MRYLLLCFGLLFIFLPAAHGAEADVIRAEAIINPDGSYTFNVTVKHHDEGWNHYADRWEVLTPDARVIATRTLYHPHVNEQPFTRSLSGVKLPERIAHVEIRAHDSIHGYGGKTIKLKL